MTPRCSLLMATVMTPVTGPMIDVAGRKPGGGQPFLIAGPCVLEVRELTRSIAERLVMPPS